MSKPLETFHIRDRRGGDRFVVHNAVIKKYGPSLGPYGIAVYAALAMHATDTTGQAWPSVATIAHEIGASTSSVRRSLKDLETARLVHVERQYDEETKLYSTSIYTLLDPLEGTIPQTVPLPEGTSIAGVLPFRQEGTIPQTVPLLSQGQGGTIPQNTKQEPINKNQGNKNQEQEFAAVAAAPPPPDPPPPAVKPAPKPRSRKPTRTPEQHALQERVVQALEEVTGKPRTVNQSGYQAVGWWLVDSFPDLGETLPEVVRERYAEDAPPADGWQWYTHDFRGMGRKEPSKRPTVFQVRETIYDALQPPPAPTVALTPYTNGHSRDRPASFAGMQIEQSLASIAAMREERLRRETGGT